MNTIEKIIDMHKAIIVLIREVLPDMDLEDVINLASDIVIKIDEINRNP